MEPNLIIKPNDKEFVNSWAEQQDFDPVFQLPGLRSFRLPTIYSKETTLEYLAYRVLQHPKDLLTHMQRIFLEVNSGKAERIYAAVLDLFIVLDDIGEPLKNRLLKQIKPRISASLHQKLLEMKQGTGVFSGITPNSAYSVMSNGVVGLKKLIDVSASKRSESQLDPLVEAQACLEYSQVDEAREILEQAILQMPERQELHLDLLDIYRTTQDSENFRAMFEQLNAVGNAFSDTWNELAELFKLSELS